MTRSERDLVGAIRAELAAIDPARPCDRRAERAGLATATVARDPALARLWFRLGREPHGREPSAAPHPTGRATLTTFDWAAAASHCRLAWLRGLFLARGSLSLAGGRTHLEFLVAPEDAPILADRLTAIGLPAGRRIRRGRGVVTWKGGEAILGFLGRIGASATLLELEARQVGRAIGGEINRVVNAESANLRRAVGAAGRQLAAIEILEADGRLAEQPEVVRRVAAGRRETPEATLTELAERLDLHRSRVQRSLERLERLGLESADDDPPRRRAASGRARPRRDRLPTGSPLA